MFVAQRNFFQVGFEVPIPCFGFPFYLYPRMLSWWRNFSIVVAGGLQAVVTLRCDPSLL
jgi:hypothetical protein